MIGFTPKLFPALNFTANDISPTETLYSQIWELGNSLAFMTGEANSLDITVQDPQKDPGHDLIDCYQKANGGKI